MAVLPLKRSKAESGCQPSLYLANRNPPSASMEDFEMIEKIGEGKLIIVI